MEEEVMLSLEEAAALLHLSPDHLRHLIETGRVAGVLAGGEWRLFRADVEQHLREGFYNVAGEE